MSTELAIQSFEEISKVAGAMVKSGYFHDASDVSQAIVKILAGAEIGIGAFQAMQSIYIIQGRPSMSANLMAAKVKSSGRYDYRVIRLDDTGCEVAFFQQGAEIGRSVFTLEDARKAGTKNLDKYPRNMLFSRAMSNGVRWYCPDVLGAAPVYTPDELGAEQAEDGSAILDLKPITPAPAGDTNLVQTAQTNQPQTENKPEPAQEQHQPYTGKVAKIGKNVYPTTWTSALMSTFVATGELDIYHLDGVLQKLQLPFEATADEVIEKVKEYQAQK